ncbi:S24 family peptidase, partial [[Clostridium] innocuum]|nr:S24 family peptidase [[Clostridium] innocuum]
EPLFSNDDNVAIKKDIPLNIGDVGLFILNGECLIKKYEGNKLVSLNKKYSDIILSEFDNLKYIGKVIGKI